MSRNALIIFQFLVTLDIGYDEMLNLPTDVTCCRMGQQGWKFGFKLLWIVCVLGLCLNFYLFQVKLGNTCFKTEICKKSLNPQWNSDWFRFEVGLPSFIFLFYKCFASLFELMWIGSLLQLCVQLCEYVCGMYSYVCSILTLGFTILVLLHLQCTFCTAWLRINLFWHT